MMGIRKTIRRWNTYQQTVRELNTLGNRELADLGITRRDINRVARDTANQL